MWIWGWVVKDAGAQCGMIISYLAISLQCSSHSHSHRRRCGCGCGCGCGWVGGFGIKFEKQGFRTLWYQYMTGQKFQGLGLKLKAFILAFRDLDGLMSRNMRVAKILVPEESYRIPGRIEGRAKRGPEILVHHILHAFAMLQLISMVLVLNKHLPCPWCHRQQRMLAAFAPLFFSSPQEQ